MAAGLVLLVSALALPACSARSSPPRPPESPRPAEAPAPAEARQTPPVQPVTGSAAIKLLAAVQKPPVWRPGDRWIYGVLVGTEQGTKTVEVAEVRDIGNAPFYVLRVGELEHFYTTQLQWAGHARDRKIESRINPPLPWFAWPLDPGRRWTYRGTLQDSTASVQREDTFLVLGAEVVEVPAGRFNAIKILHEGDKGDRNEYWYAPDVRSYIKWVWHRGPSSSEELLREFHAASRN
jgi:hypothetical protein